MSLYNMLFGVNPLSGMLLNILGTDGSKIPRFRDCYLTNPMVGDEKGPIRVCIYTRTGGGNRDWYESRESRLAVDPELSNTPEDLEGPYNADLRKIDGFVSDQDDEFDSTYAKFFYEVPQELVEMFERLQMYIVTKEPAERWRELIDEIKAAGTSDAPPSPMVQRALAIGEKIFEEISKTMKREE